MQASQWLNNLSNQGLGSTERDTLGLNYGINVVDDLVDLVARNCEYLLVHGLIPYTAILAVKLPAGK